MHKPPLFVQVDMDGLWAIRRCYRRPVGDSYENDPVWKQGVGEFARLFEDHGIRATFFLVGRDMMLEWKRERAHMLHESGHEIANHSYTHTIGMTRMGMGTILKEIQHAHMAIVRAGLPAPIGFRSPGYDIDVRIIRALRRLGYLYDASMLPTRLSPLLRLADAWLARAWQPDKSQFGRFAYGASPRVPYYPDRYSLKSSQLGPQDNFLEIPVTTLPPLGVPLTASAIFSLGPHKVFQILRRERWRARPVTLLLHGIDLTDTHKPIIFGDRTSAIGGFNKRAADKRRLIEPVLKYLVKEYNVVPVGEYAQIHLDGSREISK